MKKIISVIITLLLVIPVSIFYSSAQETNIALGKSYSYTGTYVDEGVIMYPDTDRKELTDGIKGDGDDMGRNEYKRCQFTIQFKRKNS